ncbi:recombination protein RecT [Eleftheria terrae]|uniref:recombination protein RecT n=1 Tax=Eleftheria terrae TaxID=1597781 RepID=UPI00263B5E05|nr:recombination protein RecT [Eleftheria terrae]WKB52985.1 recombination protein RecT [Eleftheria terrae]
MSTTALKAAATGKTAVAEKPKDLAHLLASPGVQSQIKAALPRHMTAERMARIATTEMRKVPKLGECDPMSFLGAVIQCAQLGLEPGNSLGHAYLLPFDKRKKVGDQWQVVGTECQLIIGYRGMIDLARRSGQIVSLTARSVYANDTFSYRFGINETIEHVPAEGERGEFTHVYAVAKLKDGGVQFEVMTRHDIERVRNESQGYRTAVQYKKQDNPWMKHFDEMAKKTAIRRLFKYLPVSIEIQRAVGLDELADAGVSQQNSAVIDGDFRFVAEDDEQAPAPTLPPAAPAVTYAQAADAISKATSVETAGLALDEARDSLPPDQFDDLVKVFKAREAELSK